MDRRRRAAERLGRRLAHKSHSASEEPLYTVERSLLGELEIRKVCDADSFNGCSEMRDEVIAASSYRWLAEQGVRMSPDVSLADFKPCSVFGHLLAFQLVEDSDGQKWLVPDDYVCKAGQKNIGFGNYPRRVLELASEGARN